MLPSASDLIATSWHLYTKNWRQFLPYILGLCVPPLIQYAVGILALIFVPTNNVTQTLNSIIVIAIVAASLVFVIWTSLALITAVRHAILSEPLPPWRVVMSSVGPRLWPVIYTSLALTLIIFGGTILFIIPGIIFTGWYIFTIYAVLLENKAGLSALRESKSLVVGRWWGVMWRWWLPNLFFVLASVGIQLAFFFISWFLARRFGAWFYTQNDAFLKLLSNIVGAITGGLLAPLTTLVGVALYLAAKKFPLTTPPDHLAEPPTTP